MKTSIRIAAALCLLNAWGAELADKPKPLTEVQMLKFENVLLREQAVQRAKDDIDKEKRALFMEACADAGLKPDPGECEVNLQAKTVGKAAKPAAVVPAPAPPAPTAQKPRSSVQQSNGPNSPNVSNVQGDVIIPPATVEPKK